MSNNMEKTRFVIIGSGWRSLSYGFPVLCETPAAEKEQKEQVSTHETGKNY